MSSGAIAIIPARGGSKRIPRKNVKSFHGKPMIAWSIEAALESDLFDDVIVSTDDEEIADVSRRYGASVPFLRPAELSGDTVSIMPVLRLHVHPLLNQTRTVDFAFCIYATAPFLQVQRLRDAVTLLRSSDADFVLAVSEYDFPVQRSLRLNGPERLTFAYPEYALLRSQDLEPRFHDAGQFFGGRAEAVVKYDSALFGKCLPLLLPRGEALDIDTLADWCFAEELFAAKCFPAKS